MGFFTISSTDSIQKALRAFDPKEKSVLKLLPGIYEEDLELPSNITIEGSGPADLDFTVIRGRHIFPKRGSIGFSHIKFESDSSCFVSKPGSDFLFLYNGCAIKIDKGYPIYIPDVKGNGIFFDCWISGNDNGFINNQEGTVSMRLYNMTSESKNPDSELILNNSSLFFNVHINHRVKLCGEGAKYDIQGGCWLEKDVIVNDNCFVNRDR